MTTLKSRLSEGRTLIGLAACLVRTPEIVVIARASGFDFLLVDLEHSPITLGEAAGIAAAGAAAGFPVMIRVGGPDHPDLARALDCGAEGLVVPHVDTEAQARRIVDLCRFRPVGKRSLPSPLVRLGYATPPAVDLMAATEADTFLIAMIESGAGLRDAAAMAALPGIDALMIGANDLAQEIGHTGDVGHPEVLEAFRSVAAAAAAAGKTFATIGLAGSLLHSHGAALGARLCVATNDVNLLADGGAAIRSATRAAFDHDR